MKSLARNLTTIVIFCVLIWSPGRVVGVHAQSEITGNILLVTSMEDNGEGSLRQAIANAQAGDTIQFDPAIFPKETPQTILIETPLPFLTQGSLTINATDAGVILDGRQIEADNTEENTYFSGLVITSNGNTIKGLIILNFPGNGITVLNSTGNTIGGYGENCTFPCNVLSGNGFNGILVLDSSQTTIQGNFIGIDPSGSETMGNLLDGIRVINSYENLIGGSEDGAGNLIGANSIGIEILEEASINNQVISNVIGLDITLQKRVGNLHAAISVAWSTSKNLFENNILTGNETGMVFEKNAHDNVFRNNLVGTTPGLTSEIGNTYYGLVLGSAQNNQIGPGNVFAYNYGGGIIIDNTNNTPPTGNRITQNSFIKNGNPNINVTDAVGEWVKAPHDLVYNSGEVRGFAQPNQQVEIYVNLAQPGGTYVTTVTANNRGYFTYMIREEFDNDNVVSAIAFAEDGSTSVFSDEALDEASVITTLPGVVGPAQVSTEPKVVYTNFILAALLLAYCKVMTSLFNKTLKKYAEIIEEKIATPVSRFFARIFGNKTALLRIFSNRWINWIIFLLLIGFIQSWLNPSRVPFTERLSLTLTIFLCSMLIGFLKEFGEHLFRRWLKQPLQVGLSKIHWFGLLVAGITTTFSRLIKFSPGILLGSLDVFSYKPSVKEERLVALRILIGKSVVFLLTLGGWFLSSVTESFSPDLTALLRMVFTVALQGAFFELLPLVRSLDGSMLIKWNFWAWIGLYLPISFFTFWLVMNPNGSGIQAIQQNTMAAILIILAFLLVVLITSNMIFKAFENKAKKEEV